MEPCVDCGAALTPPKRGRRGVRCPDCQRVWRNSARRKVQERKPLNCVDCQIEFRPPKATGNLPERCEKCRRARVATTARARKIAWRAANPERAREHGRASYHRNKNSPQQVAARHTARLRQYGLTPDDLDRLLARQGNRCAICGEEHRGRGKRLHVDHDHATGKVRGLLCGPCNVALGGFNDDPTRLRAAVRYLTKK